MIGGIAWPGSTLNGAEPGCQGDQAASLYRCFSGSRKPCKTKLKIRLIAITAGAAWTKPEGWTYFLIWALRRRSSRLAAWHCSGWDSDFGP